QALYDLVWSRPMSSVAAELSLSSNGLSKICDRLLIPYPGRGSWSKAAAGRAPERARLPPAPAGVDDPIVIGAGRAASRRRRTRSSAGERREQLMDAAAAIIVEDGLSGLTMKTVARRVGISEAQAHNYYPQRRDLLVDLARRELSAMERRRRAEIDRGHDRYTKIALSTITYLREAAERGALIQVLTQSAEVREALRAERAATQRADRDQVMGDLTETYGVPRDVARAMTSVLTAICLRAGRLVGGGKLSLDAAERLTLAMTMTGNRDLMRAYRADGKDPG
ncbi:MAG: TetR/AcrR family transcriptional regulator, partial [Pseudomonadota bacterium]